MATTAPNSNATLVCGVERSLGGRSWRWRGGPNQYDGPAAGLGDDILTQLLLARGVARDDLERQREPKLAAFLPDPAIFQDMEAAAERLAQAILTREKVTIYGDYDVDGATSAALLIRLTGPLPGLVIGMRDDGIDRLVPSSLLCKMGFQQFQAGNLTIEDHLPHCHR